MARLADNPRALSYALTVKASTALAAGHRKEGLAFATDALHSAVVARDYWAYTSATMVEALALDTWSTHPFADRVRRRREELTALGGPHAYIAWLSASEANSWLALGEWRRCLERLRVALGSDPGALADVAARLAAARLSVLQGRLDEATAHLERASELFSEQSEFLGSEFNAIRAEVHLAAGDPEAAFSFALAGATSAGVMPTMCEWLIPLAARALADQIQSARDGQRDTSVLLSTTRRPPDPVSERDQRHGRAHEAVGASDSGAERVVRRRGRACPPRPRQSRAVAAHDRSSSRGNARLGRSVCMLAGN